jgi:hypothetical protein
VKPPGARRSFFRLGHILRSRYQGVYRDPHAVTAGAAAEAGAADAALDSAGAAPPAGPPPPLLCGRGQGRRALQQLLQLDGNGQQQARDAVSKAEVAAAAAALFGPTADALAPLFLGMQPAAVREMNFGNYAEHLLVWAAGRKVEGGGSQEGGPQLVPAMVHRCFDSYQYQ